MRHARIDWNQVRGDVARLGVLEGCRLNGIHRSTWYRQVKSGFTAAGERSPPTGLEEAVLQISRERPLWGCDRIAYYLALENIKVSSPTVQKILVAHGLGTRRERSIR